MSNPTPPSPPLLDYARRPTWAWISRRKRLLVVLAILGAVGMLTYRYHAEVTARATWLYWSRQCAAHRMPGAIELVVRNPQKARQLLATDPDYIRSVATTAPIAVYFPRAWRMLKKIDPRCQRVAEATDFYPAIAFMGSLRRPDGVSRLVVVSGWLENSLDLLLQTRVLVLQQPRFYNPVPPQPTSFSGGYQYSGRWMPATLRGGVIDPNDPSHVVFGLVVHSLGMEVVATSTIDAYLQNDDSITFKLRETPELSRLDVKLYCTKLRNAFPNDSSR